MLDQNHVVIAMSGGVDSSVAAALLKKQGYKVTGLMLRMWSDETSECNRCCPPDAVADARSIAEKLDIPFVVKDFKDVFKREVVDHFIATYLKGMTPNPCILCNQIVRFQHMLNLVKEMGAGYLATGHYARVIDVDENPWLFQGKDPFKDQSYMLHRLQRHQLKHAIFPLGEYTKPEIRKMAEEWKLSVYNKPDSQDLCFLADDGLQGFLNRHAPGSLKPGRIVHISGEELGTHKGLASYTVGQRKGLGIAHPEPLYVVKLDMEQNELVVAVDSERGSDELTANQVVFSDESFPEKPIDLEVKIRYKSKPVPARLTPLGNQRVHVKLEKIMKDITPGQGIAFYEGERVLGGGVIEVP